MTERCRRTIRFAGKEGYRPEIYTMGHRSSLGLTVNPTTNDLWLSEMGPNGGDEINILKAGAQLRLAAREPGPHVSRPVAGEDERAHA